MPFSIHLAATSEFPIGLEIDRAEGLYIYTTNGRRYLDLISGLAVANLGHRHPAVVSAVVQQMERYTHVIPYGEFSQSPQNDLADALAAALPANLNTCYFVNSGTEANEAALKLAKRYTGRNRLVAVTGSYHGATHGSLSVTGNEMKKQRVRPMLPGVDFIGFNQASDLSVITTETAAVIIEPVMGDAGVRLPDRSFFKALRERCTAVGAMLIFDEVQTGMGRTGTLFAFEQLGVTPDILTLAKALGGGMPIGAFIAELEVMRSLSQNPPLGHITTFGGHPVCCAAALANLNELRKGNLIAEANNKGTYLAERLRKAGVAEVRQIGLMLAADLHSESAVSWLVNDLLKKGIITFYFLSCRTAFRLAPPLTIGFDELEWACTEIQESISRLPA